MRLSAFSLVLALFALPVASAHATSFDLAASIDGAQANTGNGTGSAGTGSVTLTYDDATMILGFSGSFSGLTEAHRFSHFHGPAAAGQDAAVVVTLNVNEGPGGLSGTFSGTEMLDSTEEADLLNGLWYVNIHSDFVSAGEIRGQINVVPEPGSAALLGLGLLGLAVRRPLQ